MEEQEEAEASPGPQPASLASQPSTSPLTWSVVEAGQRRDCFWKAEGGGFWARTRQGGGGAICPVYFSIFWVGCSFLFSFLGRFLEPSTVTLAELGEKFLVGIPAWGLMS